MVDIKNHQSCERSESVTILDNRNVTVIRGNPMVKKLVIKNCTKLLRIESFINLEELSVKDCPRFNSYIECDSLNKILYHTCPSISNIDCFGIKQLGIKNCQNIKFIKIFRDVDEIFINNCEIFENFILQSRHIIVNTITIKSCPMVTNLDFVTNFIHVIIQECTNFRFIAPRSNHNYCHMTSSLHIINCDNFQQLINFTGFGNILIKGCKSFENVSNQKLSHILIESCGVDRSLFIRDSYHISIKNCNDYNQILIPAGCNTLCFDDCDIKSLSIYTPIHKLSIKNCKRMPKIDLHFPIEFLNIENICGDILTLDLMIDRITILKSKMIQKIEIKRLCNYLWIDSCDSLTVIKGNVEDLFISNCRMMKYLWSSDINRLTKLLLKNVEMHFIDTSLLQSIEHFYIVNSDIFDISNLPNKVLSRLPYWRYQSTNDPVQNIYPEHIYFNGRLLSEELEINHERFCYTFLSLFQEGNVMKKELTDAWAYDPRVWYVVNNFL